ncbi:MAG TPA: hypothetical protein VJA85_08245 [Candidatus Limnocylindria bacterium]|nr:hypothetical protein [Candidatus Limnocylindria bacterium]
MASTRARARAAPIDLAAVERAAAAFVHDLPPPARRHLERRRWDAGLTPALRQAKGLFEPAHVGGLRSAAIADGAQAPRARALLAFVAGGHLALVTAPLTDAIAAAEASATVIWRGEEIGYHALRRRIAAISARTERNALYASYLAAEEAINPLRWERGERIERGVRELGFADGVELAAISGSYDPDALGVSLRAFLTDSETLYYAAIRRYLARIEVEQGDASTADLWHLLSGSGWDHFFEPRATARAMDATLRGLGLEAPDADAGQPGAGTAGWDRLTAALRHVATDLRERHADPAAPSAPAGLADPAAAEATASLFGGLPGEAGWLAGALGVPPESTAGLVDFHALATLWLLRSDAARLLYQLRLHRGGAQAVHRAEYAGMVGLLTGINEAEERYLVTVADGLRVADDLRGRMLGDALRDHLEDHHSSEWWSVPAVGTALGGLWRETAGWSAERVLARLGYDALDWRPGLRRLRVQLIGEMSGYGGPNITTRAGTRKV